jgi:prolyl-tRNA synthetase
LLKNYDIRTVIDDRNEKIGKKIRDNELKRIPYMLVVGEREAQEQKNKSLKNVMWGLVAVAAVMACALAYIWASKSSLVRDLNAE